MITDYTNPHEDIKPLRVEKNEVQNCTDEFRVVKIEGLYMVQRRAQGLERETDWKVSNQKPLTLTYLPAVYQTLQEAENYIKKCRSESIIYYY